MLAVILYAFVIILLHTLFIWFNQAKIFKISEVRSPFLTALFLAVVYFLVEGLVSKLGNMFFKSRGIVSEPITTTTSILVIISIIELIIILAVFYYFLKKIYQMNIKQNIIFIVIFLVYRYILFISMPFIIIYIVSPSTFAELSRYFTLY